MHTLVLMVRSSYFLLINYKKIQQGSVLENEEQSNVNQVCFAFLCFELINGVKIGG